VRGKSNESKDRGRVDQTEARGRKALKHNVVKIWRLNNLRLWKYGTTVEPTQENEVGGVPQW
jgi:hypothetical protein